MNVLDRAQAHFDAYKARPLAIEEWPDEKGKPTEVFVRPLSLGERRVLDKKHGEDSAERMVTIVIRNVVDKDDKPIFDETDRAVLLKKVSASVLQRLALAASGVDLNELIGIQEKN